MSDSDVEYATEEETRDFINLLCDRPGDCLGDESSTRYKVAVQLAVEYAEEVGLDTSTTEGKREFASDIYLRFKSLNVLARIQLGIPRQPLEKRDYLKYVGALWRTMPENNFLPQGPEDIYAEQRARMLEERNYKE
jgi:hypothetical protein